MALHVKTNNNGIGDGVVYYFDYLSKGGETILPSVADPNLKKASYVLVFMEGDKLTAGDASDEYQNTAASGYITLNFLAPSDNRFTIIGFGSGGENVIIQSNNIVNTQITQPKTNAELNALYPNSLPSFMVFCPNIIGGGLTYIYLGSGFWSSSILTLN